MLYVSIAVFGAAGSLARFGVQGAIQRASGAGFPWGTLVVNVTGSFVVGFIAGTSRGSPEFRTGLLVGLCGGYTTFSTFSIETVRMLQEGAYGRAAAYIGASVFISLLMTIAGLQVAGRV